MSDCKSSEEGCLLITFADDTVMMGHIDGDDDDRAYIYQLQSFIDCCDTNFLEFNVSKTKEIIIDSGVKTIPLPAPPPTLSLMKGLRSIVFLHTCILG